MAQTGRARHPCIHWRSQLWLEGHNPIKGFGVLLTYKAALVGGEVLMVGLAFSSQTCKLLGPKPALPPGSPHT